jgi:hypothetical protein
VAGRVERHLDALGAALLLSDVVDCAALVARVVWAVGERVDVAKEAILFRLHLCFFAAAALLKRGSCVDNGNGKT